MRCRNGRQNPAPTGAGRWRGSQQRRRQSSNRRAVVKHFRAIAAAGLLAATTLPAAAADITGAGSTFVYPVLAKWADVYRKDTGVGLNYQSIGSGGGIKQITNKTVTFGATDMP